MGILVYMAGDFGEVLDHRMGDAIALGILPFAANWAMISA
ncbi:hypothetical protein M2360_001041 [Rhizobium sp. SG_E_25_P2]|nr:hypothetical protein [Rhizobium sp. SG_E_25_P2]